MIDDLTPDQYAVICNALIDGMLHYERGSLQHGIYARVAGEILEDLGKNNHPFYRKLENKFIVAQIQTLCPEWDGECDML